MTQYPYALLKSIAGTNTLTVSKKKEPERNPYLHKLNAGGSIKDGEKHLLNHTNWLENCIVFTIEESESNKAIQFGLKIWRSNNPNKLNSNDFFAKGIDASKFMAINDENNAVFFIGEGVESYCKKCNTFDCKCPNEVNDENINKFINTYIKDLPKNWRTDLDMYLAMKNTMIEALSFNEKYLIYRNQK